MPDPSDTLNASQDGSTLADGPSNGHRTPAAVVCQVFGSSRQVALHLGLNPSSTWRWLERGLVPAEYHVPLLDAAERIGLTLTAEDLVRGRAHTQSHAPEEG